MNRVVRIPKSKDDKLTLMPYFDFRVEAHPKNYQQGQLGKKPTWLDTLAAIAGGPLR